jgi:hypothetical protein
VLLSRIAFFDISKRKINIDSIPTIMMVMIRVNMYNQSLYGKLAKFFDPFVVRLANSKRYPLCPSPSTFCILTHSVLIIMNGYTGYL